MHKGVVDNKSANRVARLKNLDIRYLPFPSFFKERRDYTKKLPIMSTEIASVLSSRAEEEFGKERAEQLRSDIEQAAGDIEKLRMTPIELEDEP